jgi:hypothetical protein
MRRGQGRRAAARRVLAMTAAVVAVATAVVAWGGQGVAILADVVWM